MIISNFSFLLPFIKRFSFVFFFFISLWCQLLLAQTTIRGKLIDKETKEPLVFAHIVVNAQSYGVMTDINGVFTITQEDIEFLRCSYVGYKTLDYPVDTSKKDHLIKLEVDNNNLETLELIAKENPANRIIREVIKNKSKHNPEQLPSFVYQCYNKVIYDFIYANSEKGDSIKENNDEFLHGGHMMMSESVTERKYLAPNYSEETILATRFSGIKNPSFTSLATDLQPFSFYKDIIPFLDVNYLNPISNGSLNKYQFYIRDTILYDIDTTYIIEYYPQAKKNFEGLKGLLYINTNGFALEHVIAEPYESGKINLKIQQKYTQLSTGEWFPEQLNYSLRFKEYPSENVQIGVDGKSYISHVQLNQPFTRKDFSIDQVKISPLATKQSTTFWNDHRSIGLNNQEKTTYLVIDSIGEKYHLDTYMNLSENLANGIVDFKHVELDFNKALGMNLYEGLRLGVGLNTGDSISETFKVGGYFAYGFKDKASKYGSFLNVVLDREQEAEIHIQYQDDIQEFGTFYNRNLGQQKFSQRTFLSSEMNRVKHLGVSLKTRMFRYLQTEFVFSQDEFIPQYTYLFKGSLLDELNVPSFGVNLRYAYKEKYIQTMGKRISMGTSYPVLSCSIKTVDDNVLNSDVSFTAVKVKAEFNRFWKNLGKTHFTLESGRVFNNVPAPLLFSGEGSLDDRLRIFIPQTFQTVTPYEFLSNQFVHFYLHHNFGSLLFKTEKFKPQFSLVHNMGWSQLDYPENHLFTEAKQDMSKGFMESGLIVDNILRVNYLNMGYLGLGVGVFGRYGAYAHDKTSDNLLYKISFIFTTR